MKYFLAVPFLLLVANAAHAETAYRRIGPGPELVQAKAYCEIQAMNVGQGYYAYGRPGFVAGASLGNAIGNAIQQDQFMKNCLILNGWERYKVAPPPSNTRTNFNNGTAKKATKKRPWESRKE